MSLPELFHSRIMDEATGLFDWENRYAGIDKGGTESWMCMSILRIDLKKAWRCCISNDTESMYSARDIGTGS